MIVSKMFKWNGYEKKYGFFYGKKKWEGGKFFKVLLICRKELVFFLRLFIFC